jgi:hypothetical protein
VSAWLARLIGVKTALKDAAFGGTSYTVVEGGIETVLPLVRNAGAGTAAPGTPATPASGVGSVGDGC